MKGRKDELGKIKLGYGYKWWINVEKEGDLCEVGI